MCLKFRSKKWKMSSGNVQMIFLCVEDHCTRMNAYIQVTAIILSYYGRKTDEIQCWDIPKCISARFSVTFGDFSDSLSRKNFGHALVNTIFSYVRNFYRQKIVRSPPGC